MAALVLTLAASPVDLLAAVEAAAHSGFVAKRTWSELDPRIRGVIIVVGALEGILKLAALIDLARRPAHEVRGPKTYWAVAITLINSIGAVPIAYFVRGRRESWPSETAISEASARGHRAS